VVCNFVEMFEAVAWVIGRIDSVVKNVQGEFQA
jgi:hypothetical protein